MLIRNLQSLFDGLEPPTGRLESGQPDVIAKKEDTTVIIPEKFKNDIERLESYCGVELRSGLCIEIELSELLEILPRERRRKDSYDKLVKFLAEEMNVQLTIKSRNYGNRKKIKGKRCRYYTNGYIWVSEDGTVVAIKQKSGYWKYFDIKTDGNGEKFVNTGYMTIYIKKAVFTCFCYCDDPNKTQIWYRDGNPANLYYKNLVAREPQSFHTTAPTFEHISGLTITKEGKVFYNGEEVRICDCVGDADTDSMVCVEPYVSNPKGRGHLNIDDLMADAGYIFGNEYALEDPVILHKDYNPTNFDSSNLEWVEITDPRYIEYKNKKLEWKHQRNIELNPGRRLHPGCKQNEREH